jgi:uncharacterized protein
MRRFGLATAVTLVLLSPLSARAQQIQISRENKTIAITTSDDAAAPADTAVVNVGFQVFGKDQDSTYQEASKTSNSIFASLTSAGIPKDAIESTSQGLSPLAPAGEDDKARYAQGLRFQFSQVWQVTVTASAAAKVLQLAIASGANNSGNIDWQLRKEDALQAEAAAKALSHAREIASAMAKGLGAKLGALIYASNQTPRPVYASLNTVEVQAEPALASTSVAKAAPLAISPQRITKTATVYAVFAIE